MICVMNMGLFHVSVVISLVWLGLVGQVVWLLGDNGCVCVFFSMVASQYRYSTTYCCANRGLTFGWCTR